MKRFKQPFHSQGLYVVDDNGDICGKSDFFEDLQEGFRFAAEIAVALNEHREKAERYQYVCPCGKRLKTMGDLDIHKMREH